VPVGKIVRFLQSDIAGRMRKGRNMRREMPFATLIPPGLVNMANEGEMDEEMVLHGVIDCLFEDEDGGVVIVDYKTGRMQSDGAAADLVLEYRAQMELYEYAVERIFGMKVSQRVIYFFDGGVEVVV